MKIPSLIELHGAVTHFPIAFLLLAVAIDLGACTLQKAPEKQRVWRQFSLTLLGLAFVCALPSLLTGYLFGRNLARPPVEYQNHWIAAVLATVLSGTLFAWRWLTRDQMKPPLRALSVGLTLLGAISVGWTGHLGGQMVFGDDQPEVVALNPTPPPAPDSRDEKLDLFADKMGVVAGKLDLTTEKLALKMQPQPTPATTTTIIREKTTKVVVPAPAIQPPAQSETEASRATRKLDEVAERYLSVAEKLDRLVSRMEKVPAAAPAAKTSTAPPHGGATAKAPTKTTEKTEAEIAQPVTPPVAAVESDARLVAAGEKLYSDSETGCINCHKLAGKGGRGGPPLDGIGSERPEVDWHIAHLVNPSSKVPGSKMPAYDDLNQEQLRAIAHYLVSLK